jgi:hypothetical protein
VVIVALLVLGFVSIGLLVWLTLRRTLMRVREAAAAVPVGPGLRLFEDPLCCLEGVLITDIVVLKSDVLVGYRDGSGSGFTVDPRTDDVLVTTDLHDADGQLLLPKQAHDRRSMNLLQQWRRDQIPLHNVVSPDHGLVAIVDTDTREAVIAEFALRL